MSRLLPRLGLVLLAAYFLTGFYVIRGNEKAAVRRFGRLDLPLRSSGLHYDWPYPFSQVNRIHFGALSTVTLGGPTSQSVNSALNTSTSASRPLLTGDQNLLQVRAQIQYRPCEAEIGDYLFAQQAVDQRLRALGEATLADLISRSGVDFAHVRGIAELNERLTARLQSAASRLKLGIEIEQAVIEQVEPPVRVKAEFLDVSNAQAEEARSIQDARTWAEQQESLAESERRRLIENAAAERQSQVIAARGSADRFQKLVAQMHAEADRLGGSYADVRQLTVQRMSWQTLNEIWPKVRKKTIVDGSGPVDVSVFPKR